MDRIDFGKLGGFPVTQFTFDFMQKSYSNALAGIAKTFGDNVILTGCEVNSTNITDGWVSVGGELLPFIGGAIGALETAQIIIIEAKAKRLFQDNEEKEIYVSRVAKIGSPGISFSIFRRLVELVTVWQSRDLKEIVVDAAYIAANFEVSGLGKNNRKGWAICNGQNGTPDLRKRVTVGYDPDVVAFDVPGKTGGASEKYIGQANLPSIKLDVPIPTTATSQDTSGAGRIVLGNGPNDVTAGPTLKTSNLGSGVALDVMQPYLVTLKIMKL